MEKTKEPIHSEANPNYSGTGTQQGRPEQYLQRPATHAAAYHAWRKFYDAPHTANRVFGAPGQTMSQLSQPQVQSHASAAAAEHQLGTTGYLPTTSTGVAVLLIWVRRGGRCTGMVRDWLVLRWGHEGLHCVR
ncbi:hypothetical protein KC368_g25 [Hortaea werneckii]|nr:hypothetical protein KC368_g25 [Hortaea werneckii]